MHHRCSIAHRERIARFCRERGVRSLALFGSVLREDFEPERSDTDGLAEFAAGALRGVGLRYFDFAEELGAILGHRVDFSSQLHPLLRDRVSREAVKFMSRREPELTLRQMVEFADEIAGLIAYRTRDTLETSREFRRALERCVELIGEAATRRPEERRTSHPEIPWRQIIAMRNERRQGPLDR